MGTIKWIFNQRAVGRIARFDAAWVKKHPGRKWYLRRSIPGEFGQPANISGVVVVHFLSGGLHLKAFIYVYPTGSTRERLMVDRSLAQLFGPAYATDQDIERDFGEFVHIADAVEPRGASVAPGSGVVQ